MTIAESIQGAGKPHWELHWSVGIQANGLVLGLLATGKVICSPLAHGCLRAHFRVQHQCHHDAPLWLHDNHSWQRQMGSAKEFQTSLAAASPTMFWGCHAAPTTGTRAHGTEVATHEAEVATHWG